MRIETNAYKLTNEFWQDYPHEKHPEILLNEKKLERPYMLAIDEETKQKFAIPFRSNAKHEFVYKFEDSSRKDEQGKPTASKIDFSKAIPIFKDSHIKKQGKFNSVEREELIKNKEKIALEAERYFKTWRKNELKNENKKQNEMSPIKYFKNELGWSREQQLEKKAQNKEIVKQKENTPTSLPADKEVQEYIKSIMSKKTITDSQKPTQASLTTKPKGTIDFS